MLEEINDEITRISEGISDKDILNDDARIMNDSNDDAGEEKTTCSQCGDEIEGEVWYCYYADQYSEDNLLCGEGECWADWMQDNTVRLGDY